MGTKSSDLAVAAGCQHCHDLLDQRDPRWAYLMTNYPAAVLWRILKGLCETQARLEMLEIISVKGATRVKGGGIG